MTKPASSDRPRCPGCTRRMTLHRNSKRAAALSSLNVFECSRCGYVFAEAIAGGAPIAERASVLHLEAYTIQH